MPALVFDLGGTHLRCGVASDGVVRRQIKQRIQNYLHGFSSEEIALRIAAQIEAYAAAVAEEAASRDPIVFSFPGPIDKRGVTLDAPTVFGKTYGRLPDLPGELRRRTRREVHLLNDVSAAAWCLSRKTAENRFMVVTVSSGIGSKVFDRAHPSGVMDDLPFAGEIGHYVVDCGPGAPVCDCGGVGHLGAIASGRGVERRAQRARGDASLTNEEHIVPAIRRGEDWAMDVLRQCCEPLVRTLLAVTMGVGLEKIFIIGGFAQSIGPVYEKLLNELLVSNSRYHLIADRVPNIIELGGIDEESCLEGAAIYAAARRLGGVG
jgi:predicted NBD/HSP70 family sugar kinase